MVLGPKILIIHKGVKIKERVLSFMTLLSCRPVPTNCPPHRVGFRAILKAAARLHPSLFYTSHPWPGENVEVPVRDCLGSVFQECYFWTVHQKRYKDPRQVPLIQYWCPLAEHLLKNNVSTQFSLRSLPIKLLIHLFSGILGTRKEVIAQWE